jgi:hypothetical protein
MNTKGAASGKAVRCRPGDIAKIKVAWNALLRGQFVLVRRAYGDGKWLVRLLGEPAFCVSEDRKHFVDTRTLIADDWALEPLRGEPLALDDHLRSTEIQG